MLTRMSAFTEAHIMTTARAFKKRIEGATAIEYGLIAGGISLAIVASVFLFGDKLSSLFEKIATSMSEAVKKVD